MDQVFKALENEIEGDVRTDEVTKKIYSVDASIYELEPLAVVLPKTQEDVIKAIQIASAFNVSVTMRGAATGITGGCLGSGIIIDTSKYLHRILEINKDEEYAICEPGVVQDVLNKELASFGYRLGPDTSTGNRATIGGMVANNAAGAHSIKFGKMVDHVLAIEGVLGDGERMKFKSLTDQEYARKRSLSNHEGDIYRAIDEIQNKYSDEIRKRFPDIPRRVSGYNLDQLIAPGDLNLSRLLVGSEGTLVAMTSIKVKIVPALKRTGLCLLYFQDMIKALKCVPDILAHNPIAVELIDSKIIEAGKVSPSLKEKIEWLQGSPKALLIVEFEENAVVDVHQQLAVFQHAMLNKSCHPSIIMHHHTMAQVWMLRKSGLGMLLSKRSYSRAIAFLEDISVSPYKLAHFMEEFISYMQKRGLEAGIYGHVGSGCMHIRPYINLREQGQIDNIIQIMGDISDLLLRYGGSLSGEHGDGLIRSWLNQKMFGKEISEAFVIIKKAFDPHLILNPGKIVFPADPTQQLRLTPETPVETPPTFLNFEREGGFDLAVDLCNGNGLCRKKEGIMCPSFQVDDDEYHSTRARAQTLRGVIHGQQSFKGLSSQELHDVLDLCVMCKGCKTECPSQVDMAKMKAESLYHYHKEHGMRWRDYLFAYVGEISRIFSWAPAFFNSVQNSFVSKKLLSLLGVSSQRVLPSIAQERFSSWFKRYQQPKLDKQVVLFNDTFNEFNHPEIGKACVRVLNRLGYEVIVPPWRCCGRPQISKGLLQQAKKSARAVIDELLPYARQKLSIIGLEPSCILSIKDDYSDFSESEEVQEVMKSCVTFDEFIANHSTKFYRDETYASTSVWVHGHCHQKALVGMTPTLSILRSIPGLKVSLIDSGCCGMAGSFGYESEHYEFSMKIGELKLFSAIRKMEEGAIIIANGTSCRHQILEGTGISVYHLAEFLDKISYKN